MPKNTQPDPRYLCSVLIASICVFLVSQTNGCDSSLKPPALKTFGKTQVVVKTVTPGVDAPEPVVIESQSTWTVHDVGLNGAVSTYTPEGTGVYEECVFAGLRDDKRFDIIMVWRFSRTESHSASAATEVRVIHVPARKDAWFDFRGVRFWVEAVSDQALTVRYKKP